MKKIITIFTISSLALLFSIAPVLAVDDQMPACDDECNDSVSNRNCAMVMNMVQTRANTGLNMAEGSYAGAGGDGGAIVNSGEGDIEESTSGNGGTGGNTGMGGAISTGDATAGTEVKNLVNSNLTDINRCGCEASSTDCECSNDRIRNSSRASLMNGVMTDANTGINEADGSYAGTGGAGGAVVNNNGGDIQGSTTGSGANGGSSVDGGLVQTGISTSLTSVINVVNRNLTRILR